jgi:outer membrane protein TolC
MNAIAAARQYREVTDFLREATYRRVLTTAKQTFFQTLLLRAVRDVARQSEENAHANYQDVAEAFELGLASEFEVLQGEVRWREAVPATAEAQRDYELALVGLKNLAGLSQDEEITLRGSLETYPPLPPPSPLGEVLVERPDYEALLWQEKLYQTQVKAERSGYLPSLGAFARYGYTAQSDEWSFDNDNKSLTVGLNLSIPIFQGGETRARVARAKIQLDRARLQTDQAREDIDRELRSLRLRLEEAHARITSAEATLTTARRAFEIAEATSQAGLTTQLELKDSRVTLDQAAVGHLAAIYQYLAACFEWDLATGAFEEPVAPDRR